jgi:pilus assembly protein Flp/PilA
MKNALKNLKNKIPTLLKKENGATMVEYAIMLALIAIVSIVMIRTLGETVSGTFQTINNSMTGTG